MPHTGVSSSAATGSDFILESIYGIKPRALLQSPPSAFSSIDALAWRGKQARNDNALKTHMHRHMVPGAGATFVVVVVGSMGCMEA